jgi:hypothetical protein
MSGGSVKRQVSPLAEPGRLGDRQKADVPNVGDESLGAVGRIA